MQIVTTLSFTILSFTDSAMTLFDEYMFKQNCPTIKFRPKDTSYENGIIIP
jgi:hypothetical protein